MKKLNKFFAILVALAMMAMLAVTSAFAAPKPASATDGTAASPAKANLVKYLELGKDVTNPNVGFKFTFTAVENTANVAVASMPTIADQVIVPNSRTTGTDKDGNSVYGVKAFADILGTSFAEAKAGVYTYTVSEVSGKVFNADGTAASLDSKYAINKYDSNSYTIRIYVNGSGTVENVTAAKNNGDAKEKIDTTDPTSEDKEGNIQISGLTFTNKATETKDVTADPAKDIYGVLNLKKTVENVSGADVTDAQKADGFTFKLTLTRAYGDETALPAAKVVTAGAEASTATTYTPALDYGENTVTLKHNQILFFETLPVGVTWTVEEDLSSTPAKHAQYQAKYDVTSAALTKAATDSAAAGVNLKTGTYDLKEATTGEKAVYTNKYDDKLDNPEGILISNLPYIALALVAIGGLVAYVVVRRKADDEA